MAEPKPNIPQVTDLRPKIAGLLPKNAQNMVLGGVALVMILVIVFSGRTPTKTKTALSSETALSAVEPNQSRIQQYRSRIDDETRKLAAEEEQLARTKQALSGGEGAPTPIAGPAPRPDGYRGYAPMERVEPQRTWVDMDREKRQYQSLFASNIALSLRQPFAAKVSGLPSSPVPASLRPTPVTEPSSNAPGDSPEATADSEATGYRLFEGTILETVLTNRLDGSFSGPVDCMVTTPVYSHDGARLLIPQGTRVLGEVKKLESFGQGRLAVFFHRLLMPDGFSVSLDQFQGLDQIGQTGLRDQVDHHYFEVFGVSIAIGAIAGLSQVNTRYGGVNESAADAYQQGVASSLSQSSLHILDRYLNVLPTFTIREGYRVKVYLSQDLVLPAYDQHPVRNDL